jgi:hypothetical protein
MAVTVASVIIGVPVIMMAVVFLAMSPARAVASAVPGWRRGIVIWRLNKKVPPREWWHGWI